MINYKQKLHELLSTTVNRNASDLHLIVDRYPMIRIDSTLIPLNTDENILSNEYAEGLILELLTPEQKIKFINMRQLDFSYDFENKARFRVNVYFQKNNMSAALRLIHSKIKTIDELGLPPILHKFSGLKQGLILVVGPTGQGKSTTLAAILNEINNERAEHIVTVEDPIEYLFIQNKSIISQREVGSDTLSFNEALRAVLRQDPNVIMVGEMRDRETIATAMTAAETGHLVFSTLHTNSAAQTIDRIIDSFPSEQQGQIVSQLASILVAIISQHLIKRIDGGRIPVLEIMVINSAIRNLIRERKIFQIDSVIATNSNEGMIPLNRSLANLIQENEISLEEAKTHSLSPAELETLIDRRSMPRSI